MNTKCVERDVYSSILQAHRRFINSEHFTSDSYERTFERIFERNFERTYEHSYQSNYESNVSSDKTIGNTSSSTDNFIISNENGLEPKQNKTQLEVFSDGDRSYGKLQKRSQELGQSPLVTAKTPAVIENHRDYRGRKF